MNRQQLAQLNFLTETALHYTSKNRGVKGVGGHICSYEAGCAIGRKIDEKLAQKLDDMPVTGVINDCVFEKLPKELQSLGRVFLGRVQSIHDNLSHWDMNGLTERGRDDVKMFIEAIIKGDYIS